MTMLTRMISDIYFFSRSYYRLKIQCNNFGGNNLANIEKLQGKYRLHRHCFQSGGIMLEKRCAG